MASEETLTFLQTHLATYESALMLMLLMKIYIELDPDTAEHRIKKIDFMLKDRNLRGQMHLLLQNWKNIGVEKQSETRMIKDF